MAKTGSSVDTGAAYFVYDEAGHLIGEYDGTGAVIQETVWLEDLPVGVLTAGGQFYVNPDHLGAPLTVTDATGQIVWRWDHDPYGNGKPNENPSGLGAFTYNLRFPGQYYDKETELHYNYFRDYNPKTGRYVQADPIGLAGGINLYRYAYADPVGYVDRYENNPMVGVGVGAEIGTLFTPGLGTVVGAIVGGVGGYLVTAKVVDYIFNSEDKYASTPTGQRGSPIDVAPGTNDSCNIGGRDYTGHSLDRMQGRGVPPSAVEDAIRNGTSVPGNQPGTTVHTGSNGVTVVTGGNGQVITVIPR